VAVVVLSVWLDPFGLLVNLTLAFLAAYLWILLALASNKPNVL
jgi:hypothetical protein